MNISDYENDLDYLKISDPLYELSAYRIEQKKELLGLLSNKERDLSMFLNEMLRSYELNRLNFLRQAGLSFLVFPSATHTRYSHSIGTLTLGNFALDKIFVQTQSKFGSKQTLRQGLRAFLRDRGWEEEFQTSLLIHDIGHFPFSHIFEQNHVVVSNNIPSHEEIMLKIINYKRDNKIDRKYDVQEEIRERAKESSLETIASLIEKYSESNITLNKKVIYEFLSDTQNCEIKIISELIHGAVDLDRLDHYNRDSYFMGLKLGNISIRGLLENLFIVEVEDSENDNKLDKFLLCVQSEGEAYVLQLLFSKELLWQKALDTDIVRCYEAMLNQAITLLLEENEVDIKKIMLMTDDELITKLVGSKYANSMIQRIRNRMPYCMVDKRVIEDLSAKMIIEKFKKWLSAHKLLETDFLLGIPPKFGKKPNKWLNIKVFDKRKFSDLHMRNKSLMDYFSSQDYNRQHTIRIFGKTQKLCDKYKNKIEEIYS